MYEGTLNRGGDVGSRHRLFCSISLGSTPMAAQATLPAQSPPCQCRHARPGSGGRPQGPATAAGF
ncbi:MAG: hypothetical protein H6577_09995 [Lewinellaceae bacterium]|nr:hypothetical protein [Saprospiraceae bacterium]MCB9338448.1 hypothetical protein [Lewinellaceae bacterium]